MAWVKRVVVQFGKNKKKTGLKDIISDIYSNRTPSISMIFTTKDGIQQITIGWKQFNDKKWKVKKGYYYLVPVSVSKTNKVEEFFATTQDLLIPNLTTTMVRMGFNDINTSAKTNKRTSVWDMFKENALNLDNQDDLTEVDFDNIEEKVTSAKINYKMGAIEILHKIFKNGKVYWPNEVKYQKIGEEQDYQYNEQIKEVHMYKKLMWDTLIEAPLQQLSNFAISSSSFNVLADWIQPLVIELKNGQKIESKQYRKKVLISNGIVRIPYLYVEPNQKTFDELVKEGIIKSERYKIGKIYKANFKNTTGSNLPLVNPTIVKIPKEEIIDLVWRLETLAVRQTVYNKIKRELSAKTSVFKDYIKTDEDILAESIGINLRDWTFNPSHTNKETDVMKTPTIEREIKISIEKFPKTAILKEENDLVRGLVFFDRPMDSLLSQLEKIKAKLEDIRDELEEGRYKLNLIKSAFFVKGWNKDLDYYKDEKGDSLFIKETKAAGSADGKIENKYLENKDWTRKMRIQMFNINKY